MNKKIIAAFIGLGAVSAIAYVLLKKKKVSDAAAAASTASSVLSTSTTVNTTTLPACANCSAEESKVISSPVTPEIQSVIDKIKSDNMWYAEVVAKAKLNGRTTEQQLKLDAVWVLANS